MEKIAKNVMKINDEMYVAYCGCSDKNHSQTLILEKDAELQYISLIIYSEIYSRHIHHKSGWKTLYYDIKFRVINSIKLLFTGRIEAENEFIFNDKESIENYISALTQALETFK